MKKLLSDFKLKEQGLNKVLGNLESEVMELIWELDKEVTVRDIYEELVKRRAIAYTTVMTIMVRLAEKNILGKRKDGNTMYFLPSMTKRDFTSSIVENVLDSLLEDFADVTMAHFLSKVSKKDRAAISKLERLLEDSQGEGEGDELL